MAINYQSTPQFFVDGIDLSAWVTAGTANQTFEQLDKTTYAIDYRSFVPGLASNSATITLYLDYAAAATYATLQPLVGTQTDIKYVPAAGALSATNPAFELTGCLLAAMPVLNMTLGELQSIDLEFVGGQLTIDTTP
jgi:hypothetical protein